jgi:hypothetical protein
MGGGGKKCPADRAEGRKYFLAPPPAFFSGWAPRLQVKDWGEGAQSRGLQIFCWSFFLTNIAARVRWGWTNHLLFYVTFLIFVLWFVPSPPPTIWGAKMSGQRPEIFWAPQHFSLVAPLGCMWKIGGGAQFRERLIIGGGPLNVRAPSKKYWEARAPRALIDRRPW